MGKPDQESAAAEEASKGDRRRRRARPWGTVVSPRKRETVLRLLRGEDLESVSRDLGITAARAAQWRDQFLAAGQASLKSRAPDAWDEANRRLQAKIGELLMGERTALREGGPVGGGRPFGPTEVESDEGRPLDLHAAGVWRAAGLPRVAPPVPTKNLIRTVCVTDRAVLGRRTITSVGMADVRSVEVDGRLASFGRSSGRRVSVHGLQAPAIRGCGQAACRW